MLLFFLLLPLAAFPQQKPGLQELSKKLNQDLPEIYDPVTKLMRTTVESDYLIYHFIIQADQVQYERAMPKVKSQVLTSACKNKNLKLILKDYNSGVVYRYENTKGQLLGQFLIQPSLCRN